MSNQVENLFTSKELATFTSKSLGDSVMQAVNSITTFDEGINFINKYANIGRNTWVATALVCTRTLSVAGSAKEQAKLLKQFQDKLSYKRAQVYNYKKAGEKLLKEIADGKLTDIESLPTAMADYIRPAKKARPNLTYVIDEEIGSFKMITGERFVIKCHLKDNKDKKAYAAITKGASNEIDKIVSVMDGKEETHYYCGKKKIVTKDGVEEAPLEIYFTILNL